MRLHLRAFLLGGLTSLLLLEAATAGQVEGRVECHVMKVCTVEDLKVTGVIDQASADKVLQLLNEAESRTDKSKDPGRTSFANYITLDSPGGSVPAAMAIGRLARQHRLAALGGNVRQRLCSDLCRCRGSQRAHNRGTNWNSCALS